MAHNNLFFVTLWVIPVHSLILPGIISMAIVMWQRHWREKSRMASTTCGPCAARPPGGPAVLLPGLILWQARLDSSLHGDSEFRQDKLGGCKTLKTQALELAGYHFLSHSIGQSKVQGQECGQ